MLADYGHSNAVWHAALKASVTHNKHLLLHVWVVSEVSAVPGWLWSGS